MREPDSTQAGVRSLFFSGPAGRIEATLNKGVLRQVSLFTTDDNHSARFTLTNGEMHVNANTMDVGEGKVSMAVSYDGPRFDIAFNPQYFIDILRHSKNETVSLGFTDAYNPGIVVDGVYQRLKRAAKSALCVDASQII